MGFRADINGLRALAVLVVVLFHFAVPGLHGGFIGVDVFFVISGYLMTAIIIDKSHRRQFSVIDFYLDRGRRIIPALAVVCVAVLALGWLLLLPNEYRTLARHALSAITFSSNIRFFHEAGYFDTSSHGNWLLHTWSLSVEWQFYLLYPVLMLALGRILAASRLRWAVLALTLLTLVWSITLSTRQPAAAFFLLPSRAWEMLAGALVFFFPLPWLTPRQRLLLELAGLGLIALALIFVSDKVVWPGYLALLPVTGAALVLLAARTSSIMTTNPGSQLIGNMSYSLYLWHWPIVVALHYVGKEQHWLSIGAGLTLSFVLAYASYRLVETPARRWGKVGGGTTGRWPTARPLLALLALVLAAASIIRMAQGFPGAIRAVNHDEKALFIAGYERLHSRGLSDAYRLSCDFYDVDARAPRASIDPACTGGVDARPVFLWGDSHAQALSLGVRTLFGGSKAVAQVATSGCRPAIGAPTYKLTIVNRCADANRYAWQQIARLKPRLVIIAQAEAHEDTDWQAIADRLHALGVGKVVLVGPMPNWRPSLPVVYTRTHWREADPYIRQGLDDQPQRTNTLLKARYGRSSTLTYISLTDVLCGKQGCLAVLPDNQGLLVVDYGHLSPAGSQYIARTILADKLSPLLAR